MAWNDRLLSFVRKYGSAAKIITSSVLNVAMPGSGALVELLDQAFDIAQDTADKDREEKFLQAIHRNAAELERLGALVDLLATDLAKVCDKALASANQPDKIEQIVREAISSDPTLTAALHKLTQIVEQLNRIETVTVATHGVVLDLLAEQQRISGLPQDVRVLNDLIQEVLSRVSQNGMQRGEVKPQHSFSIRSEDERNAVKQLLARFRRLPAAQQRQVPALLNGLGKLQIGSGDFEAARQTFTAVAQITTDAAAQAEAQFNAYRAALEEKKWDLALAAIKQAATLDSPRFAPFPIQRYQPRQILGAGGFGTAFLCHDRNFDQDVVVKTIHQAEMDRSMTDVFREARLLRMLNHPGIIGVHECEFADANKQARPYIVMDYFPGGSLQSFVQERGTLAPDAMLSIARQIAQAIHTAHQNNILHRDLKPDNVLIRKEGNSWLVKVIDFGLALRKQTIETSIAGTAGNTVLSESVAGTIEYAPPEQMGKLKGVKPGPYSDVYAFGKMCCYALFKTTEPKSRHWEVIPKDFHKMLEQCTEQELQHRLPSFEQVLQRLAALDPMQKQKQAEADRQKADADKKRREQKEAEEQQKRQEAARQRREQKEKERQLQETLRQKAELEDNPDDINSYYDDDELLEMETLRQKAELEQQLAREQKAREQAERQRSRPAEAQPPKKPTSQSPRRAVVALTGLVGVLLLCFLTFSVWRPFSGSGADQTPIPPSGPATKGEPYTNNIGMKFAWIKPGDFLMGSPIGEVGRSANETQHKVTLTKGFFMGVHLVTQEQWQTVMGKNPSQFKGEKNLPVDTVSWDDCQEFIKKLRAIDNKPYRLPTEAEWEYCCRAETKTPYHFGNTITKDQANFNGSKTTPTDRFPANAWGLHDMHGNLWQWCQDFYGPYPQNDVVDPQGPNTGTYLLLRGGSWNLTPDYCRSAYRSYYEAGIRYQNNGFRVCFCLD